MRVLLDIVRQSLATLWAHKLRSFLTMFGIAWGVGSLLLLVGLGEGFRSGQEKNLANLGQDSTERRRVAVVGWELLKNIFPGRPAVGSSILLNGISFDIIGVVAKVGREGNNGTNARIFIPIETMRMLFPLKAENSDDALSFINYQPITKEEHERAKAEVHEIIARRHDFNPK